MSIQSIMRHYRWTRYKDLFAYRTSYCWVKLLSH